MATPKAARFDTTAQSTFDARAAEIRRLIECRGWLDPSRTSTKPHALPIKRFMADWREEVEASAYETVYTALSAADPRVAFRAYVQAVGYLTRMRYEYQLPVGGLGEVLSVARSRIEAWIRLP